MRRKNDILLKSAFEESFPDLLSFFFPEANKIFAIERGFEFLDKELHELFPELEKKGGSRFVDMLVKAFLKNGAEEWILVHIEIQREDTTEFPHRMFQYWYRIHDRYNVDIVALAVFTGRVSQKQPSSFTKSFLGTEIIYKFNTFHIFDHSESQLLAMDNPFALIVLAAQKAVLADKVPKEELANQRLTIAKALIKSKRYDNEKIKRFLYFLKTFIYIDNEEINVNFDKQIAILTGNETAMGIIETIKMITLEEGIEKGIEKGRHKEQITFVTNLLLNTNFDITKIASLSGVSEDFVKNVKQSLTK
jgi:hypothetical protein